MRQFKAFTKKEFTDQFRSGKLFILGAVFIFFGIMSPALAKLMPKLLEMISAEDAGYVVTMTKEVTAADSFDQFFKNISTCLILFVILESGIFTKEYSSGTLLLSLTRGLERRKVIISKTFVLAAVWTVCYWLCFGVTLGYSAYFWDISAVPDVMTAALLWWIYGLWFTAVVVFFSVLMRTATAVLACTGAVYLGYALLGMIPKLGEYLPAHLASSSKLIHAEGYTFTAALIAAAVTGVMLIAVSVPVFDRKRI